LIYLDFRRRDLARLILRMARSTGFEPATPAFGVLRRKRLASLGRADALTLDEARRKARRYFGLVAEQTDPQARTEALWAEVTINTLVEEYLHRHAQVKKKTWRHDQSVLRRLLVPKCGTHRVGSITCAFLQALHAQKGSRTPVEANNFIKIVRKMFNWGRTAGLVSTHQLNPAVGIVPFPVKKRRRYLTRAEMPRFLAALEAEENEYARHAIWLLLLTGLRVNEILQAKWTDVDWDFRTLFIGLTKNSEPLLSPLGEAACQRLRMIQRRADNPYVICGTRTGASLVNLRKVWRRICHAADLHDLRLHDLRRTVGSWLVQEGASLHLVGAVLNHRDQQTTAGYAYFQTQQREVALTEHGRKILSYLPPNYEPLKPTYEVEPTLELPSAVPASPHHRAHYVEREVLYRLVWEAPVSEVAQRFRISDVGLAKACRRTAIPTPARGYWMRVEAGLHVSIPQLPPAPPGLPSRIRIRGKTLAFGDREE
jgi:integrase